MKGINYIRKAIDFATIKHIGQKRKCSGLDYVTHPIKVGFILQSLNMPYAVIISGILHDTLEDTDTTYDELIKEFGIEVADLVVELTSSKQMIDQIQDALDNDFSKVDLLDNFSIQLVDLIIEMKKNNKNLKGIGKNIYLINKMINMSENAFCAKLGDRLDNVSDGPAEKYLYSTLVMINEIKKRRKIISIEAQDLMDMIVTVCTKKIDKLKEE